MKRKNVLIIVIIGLICSLAVFYLSEGVRAALSGSNQVDLRKANNDRQAATSIFPLAENTSYQMDLYLDVLTRTLYGQSLIATINTSGQVLSEICLTIYPQAFQSANSSPAPAGAYYQGFSAGGIQIKQIKVNGQNTEYLVDGIALRAMLLRDLLPGEEVKIDISWQVQVPRSGYRYGVKDGVFMLGHTYPSLNVLTAKGWHSPSNSPYGDPFCLAAANYLVRINLPQEYSLATSGELVASLALDNGRVNHLIKAEMVRDFCLTACAGYETLQQQDDVVKLKCLVPAKMTSPGTALLEEAAQILKYYNCLWGSYPYREIKIVVTPMQGFAGMEYAGVVYLSQDQLDRPGLSNLLAHEIAHQWWYGLVGNDQYDEPWLDEGLASYGASLYLAHKQGRPLAPPGVVKPVNLKRGLSDFASQGQYQATVYQGGELFWWALEQELGHHKVQKILRSYLAAYKYQMASTSDLKNIINQESHRDMSLFFSRWSL
ncbi:MAG: M1 family metallopeptidase [Syntrophomonadaceae bacterium]|jgi:hypothetical protein